MSELTLLTNGKAFGGWKSIRIHLGLEELSGTFDISVTEIWPAQATPREITAGEPCTVKIGSETVITGFIDSVAVDYDNGSHGISIRGRDKTADLIDCSAVYKSGEWKNAKLEQIAKDLCAPFGISVKVEADTGAAFKSWAVEPGETVHANLERAARHRGVLLLSDGKGSMLIAKPSRKAIGIALVRGENILSASAEDSIEDRFSEYIVKGQAAGDDNTNGDAVTSQKASSKDSGVKRYRPRVIISEDQGDIASFKKRAEFEASVRAGRARSASVTVQGWIHGGAVLRPNQLVPVRDPWLKLNREMLISEVDLILDESGTRTELKLALPEAYSLQPVPEKQKDSFL